MLRAIVGYAVGVGSAHLITSVVFENFDLLAECENGEAGRGCRECFLLRGERAAHNFPVLYRSV